MSEDLHASGAPAAGARRERVVYWALLLAPLVLMIAGIATTRTPARAGLAEGARLLRERYREGDLVLVTGIGRDDAAFLLGGLPFIVVEPGVEPKTEGFEWIWVLDGKGPLSVQLPSLGVPLQSDDLRTATLSLHKPQAPLMGNLLATARVSFLRHGASEPDACPRTGADSFHCPLYPWLQVTPTVLQVEGHGLRCVHAHPAPDGVLRVELPDVPLGKQLTLQTALADAAAGVSPVTVEVRAGGRILGRFEHSRAPGLERHELDTGLDGQKATIELDLSVTSPGRHHFCFLLIP